MTHNTETKKLATPESHKRLHKRLPWPTLPATPTRQLTAADIDSLPIEKLQAILSYLSEVSSNG